MVNLNDIKKNLLLKKAILIDVREKNEWEEQHIPGALHLPLSQLDLAEIPETLPQDKTLYLHCMRGRRALRAASILKLYYEDVIPLPFSFEELLKADICIPELN